MRTVDFPQADRATSPSLVEVKPGYDPHLLLLVLMLVMTGLVMVFSASYPRDSRLNSNSIPGDAFGTLRQHLIFAAIGIALMVICSRLRPQVYAKTAGVALGLCLGSIILALVMGLKVRGTVGQYLVLGPLRFQPSEITKLALIAYVAQKLSVGPLTSRTFGRVGLKIGAVTAVLCLCLLVQRDQGMAMLVFLLVLLMGFLGGLSVAQGLSLLAIAGGLGAALAFSSPERAERIYAWLHPRAYITGAGGHILAMLLATSRGFIFGQGLGMCPEKWRQLPEPHTDSIFCVIGGELGFLVTTALVVVLALLVLRCLQIGRWSRDAYGYFLASGIGIMLGLQALINMGVALRLMPVTGLTLPFISYGGTSLISCLMGIGMVMSVFHHNPPLRREK